MGREKFLRIRVSEGELKLLANRSQLFDLSQADFIRNAIKSYNPKITQELLDKFVDLLGYQDTVIMSSVLKTSSPPKIKPTKTPKTSKPKKPLPKKVSKPIQSSPPKQTPVPQPKTPKNIISQPKPTQQKTPEEAIIKEMADELIDVLPKAQHGKCSGIAKSLLGHIRSNKSDDQLYDFVGNRLFRDVPKKRAL